jgi:hypothetical protein
MNVLVVGVDLGYDAAFFVILLFSVFFKINGIFCYLGLDAEKRGLNIKIWVAFLNNFKYPSTPFLL